MSDQLPKLPEHRITARIDEPLLRVDLSGLITLEEAAAYTRIRPERLRELAEAGYVPHFRVDGGPPLFRRGEVKDWVRRNLAVRFEGQDMPFEVRVVRIPRWDEEEGPPPPLAIRQIHNLARLRVKGPPGVYFLCLDDEVVYVGQSMNPAARVQAHTDKEFDRAYVLPVPEYALDEVEGAFIRALRPRYNAVPGPRGNGDDEGVIERYLLARLHVGGAS